MSTELLTEPRETFLSICDDLTTYYETRDMLEAKAAIEVPWSSAVAEELREVEGKIEALGAALAKKADGSAVVIHKLENEAEVARKEARRLTARADRADRAAKWLKGYLLESMRSRGLKHIKTALNTLAITKNGGVAPLVISSPTILPDDLCRMVGWIRADLWCSVTSGKLQTLARFNNQLQFERVPNNDAIREALNQPCSTCGGIVNPWTACVECGGTGKATVPGASLGERGVHLGVR